jgi:hypothetical protein
MHTGSPLGSRKSVKQNTSSTRFKSPPGTAFGHNEVTVFHIPGLDVKVCQFPPVDGKIDPFVILTL